MRIERTNISGIVILQPKRFGDQRGYFSESWNYRTLSEADLCYEFVQDNHSVSSVVGTVRGLHFQTAPHAEAKLVRCTRGALFDVCLDLRPDSPTYRQWHGEALTADNGVALFVPEGCAHGFLTLEDATEAFYMISAPYAPDAGRGVRYDDPAFGIDWPAEVAVIHPRDASYPLVSE